MKAAVALESVSKRFFISHQKARSFQDALVQFAHRQNGTREEFWALREISFAVELGQTVALIGRNGSGKSTILKLITRILEPSTGKVTVNGKVSALIELGAGFHPDLSGRENIFLSGSILGFNRKQIQRKFDDIVAFSELERFIDTPVKHYSSGMYARLGFSVAMAMDPDILIVDEVLAVGDVSFQTKCLARIQEFKRQGRTILFVSHALDTVEALCDRAIWLDAGRVMIDSSVGETVVQYLATFENGQSTGKTAGNAAEVAISCADVERIRLVSPSGDHLLAVERLSPFQVRLDCLLPDGWEDARIGLRLLAENRLGLHWTERRLGDVMSLTGPGRGRAVVEYPALPLACGKYLLHAFVSPKPEGSDWRLAARGVCTFVLAGQTNLSHALDFPVHWQSPTEIGSPALHLEGAPI